MKYSSSVLQNCIDTISKTRLIQIEKADDAVQSRLKAFFDAQDVIKSSAINVSSIATDTGISRKTFYNNDLLRLYVESYSVSNDNKTIAATEFDKLKEKYDLLCQRIQGFTLRDIDTENLRHENTMLNREIISLRNRNKSLEENNEKLQIELSNTKNKLIKGKIYRLP